MTFEDFDKFQAELLAEVTKMRDTKGKEYALYEDRFSNFKRLAEETGIVGLESIIRYLKDYDGPDNLNDRIIGLREKFGKGDPLLVLYIFMKKHWDAWTSYVRGKRENLSEPIRGRMVDLITYGSLGEGLVEENNSEPVIVRDHELTCVRCGQPILKIEKQVFVNNRGSYHTYCWDTK